MQSSIAIKGFETLFDNRQQQKPVIEKSVSLSAKPKQIHSRIQRQPDRSSENRKIPPEIKFKKQETSLAKTSKTRKRVKKRFERFDQEFANALNDPKFCEEFENFFNNHIRQKQSVESDITFQEQKPVPKTKFKKPLQPVRSRLQIIRQKRKLTVIIPTRN